MLTESKSKQKQSVPVEVYDFFCVICDDEAIKAQTYLKSCSKYCEHNASVGAIHGAIVSFTVIAVRL